MPTGLNFFADLVRREQPDASSLLNQIPAAETNPGTDSSDATSDDRDLGQGIHGILKKTDYWFNFELSQLERSSKEEADNHARAGLPRIDVPMLEELPAELVLRERATRLLLEWSERVRRKVQDAIQEASTSAMMGVVDLRHRFDEMELNKQSIRSMHEDLLQRGNQAGTDRSFEYGQLLKRGKYVAIAVLLVMVDWVANVPIFQQLLPQDPATERAWPTLMEKASQHGWASGFYRSWDLMTFRPDVSLLAIGVVAFLMLLGHFFGGSLRRIVSLRAKDETTPVIGLKTHRHQATWPVFGSLLGLILVLGFLCYSRAQLSSVTNEGLAKAQEQRDKLQFNVEDAMQKGDLDKVEQLQLSLSDAQSKVDAREEAAQYADGISKMNGAILLLNFTLVIVAIIAAYLESNAKVSEARFVDPSILELQKELEGARAEVSINRQSINKLCTEIQGNIVRARYLAKTVPLRDWEAKARRLEAVVPLFRAENARLRGVDVQNIVAFKQPCRRLDLQFSAEQPFEVPAEIDVCERNYSDLRTQMFAMSGAQ